MPEIPLPLTGACRCGRVKLRAAAPPIVTAACHCEGCRKMAASDYSLTALFPASAFEASGGEIALGGMHGPEQLHHFCAHCLSWLFTRTLGMEGMVAVRTPLFDGLRLRPYIETFASEKPPYVSTGAVEGFPGFPRSEDFQRLAEAYRLWEG